LDVAAPPIIHQQSRFRTKIEFYLSRPEHIDELEHSP